MKIGLTCGVFDLFHAGHIDLFEDFMRQKMGAEKIHVILHDDFSVFCNKQKFPVQQWRHRKRNLELSGLVDRVIMTYEANPQKTMLYEIQTIRGMYGDDVEIFYARGNDWEHFPGRSLIESEGVEIKFKDYTDGISSSKLRSEL